ncbi:hypothetical protein BZA05DRAFT_407693 [Tricharina praecox]|uniref:uncharacterized protein n=1 Tax=Tricharina praecox TaxID=43433 RepID=UPI00221F2B35|nr:uncharacterized protein BZA05DRAFT_407693 [Tricharina praecox]KAI5846014.1 hypothetical protein BZA05DRAFT_407693 [Tricharina praecox]
MSFASFLSSPTVRIVLPPPAHSDSEERLYTVHRSVLKAHTNLLSNTKPRETLCVLPNTTSAIAFEGVLEYLYTGTYNLPDEHEVLETVENTKPSPVVQAAMLGAIGVWAKPAAVHDDKSQRNISSYSSTLFPTLRNAYDAPTVLAVQPSLLPSPPPSPTFASHAPVLKKKQVVIVKTSTPASRLSAHLDIYALSRRYGVRALADIALHNIKTEVVATPAILHELVRVVYGSKQKHDDLRAFVVGIVQDHWEALKGENVFAALLKEGGEFVVDVFSRVKSF